MFDRLPTPTGRWPAVAVMLACVCAGASAPASSQPAGETTVLRGAHILDGRGEVLADRDLVVRDGRIAEHQNVLMCALGAGITWGSMIVRL